MNSCFCPPSSTSLSPSPRRRGREGRREGERKEGDAKREEGDKRRKRAAALVVDVYLVCGPHVVGGTHARCIEHC